MSFVSRMQPVRAWLGAPGRPADLLGREALLSPRGSKTYWRAFSKTLFMCMKYRMPLLWAAIALGVMAVPTVDTGAADPQRRVVICHKGQTLEIAEAALQAHLNHGDTVGPCEVTPGQNR